MPSLMVLSRKRLEEQGYIVDTVEYYNFFSKRKRDLYHMFDLVGIHKEHKGVLGVQVTSDGNMSARRTKIRENETLETWVAAGNRVEVHGWKKSDPEKRNSPWTCRMYDTDNIINK